MTLCGASRVRVQQAAAGARCSRRGTRVTSRRDGTDRFRKTQAQGRARFIMATAQVGVGDAAPDFELLAGGFQQVKLSDYKGKKVVLAFFPCCFSGAVDDGCQCQMEALTALTDAGVAVFGISRDQPFAQKAWMEKIGNPSLLCLSDFTMATCEKYVGTFNFGEFLDGVGVSKGLTGYVTSNRGCVAIDEEGKIVYKWIAFDDAGKSHPGFLPNVEEVKAALNL